MKQSDRNKRSDAINKTIKQYMESLAEQVKRAAKKDGGIQK